jgi:hypothetical protein
VIQLTEEYYAPGSLGTFNLQLQLDVVNNHPYTWKAGTYEDGHYAHALGRVRE